MYRIPQTLGKCATPLNFQDSCFNRHYSGLSPLILGLWKGLPLDACYLYCLTAYRSILIALLPTTAAYHPMGQTRH